MFSGEVGSIRGGRLNQIVLVGGQDNMWMYEIICPPETRGRRTMLVVKTEGKFKLAQIVRNFYEERINDKTLLTPTPVDARIIKTKSQVNTVHPLLFFVRASFLKNKKSENPEKLSCNAPRTDTRSANIKYNPVVQQFMAQFLRA